MKAKTIYQKQEEDDLRLARWRNTVERLRPLVERHRSGDWLEADEPVVRPVRQKSVLVCPVCGNLTGSDGCRGWRGRQN